VNGKELMVSVRGAMRTVIKENFKFCFGDGNVGEEIMVRKESGTRKGMYKKEVVNKIYFNVFARMYVEE
jgi:hypothetical protein